MIRILFRRSAAFTLVETVVALAIMVLVTVLTVVSMTGNQQRQSIVTTQLQVAGLLQNAQAEAISKKAYRGVCFKTDTSGKSYAQFYLPQLNGATKKPTNIDCDATDVSLGKKIEFKSHIAVCASCDANIGNNKSVFFDSSGFAVLNTGTRTDFQICLIHDKLPSGNRAREVEVAGIGTVSALKLGDSGTFTSVAANSGSCI